MTSVPASLTATSATDVNGNRTPLRILLAEDNPVNQFLAVRLLEKEGHFVHPVTSGRAAVAALDEHHFDLALMDVQMPEMDGFEATALIRHRERETGGRLPIIALTANAMVGDVETCVKAGWMATYPSRSTLRDSSPKLSECALS